MNIKEYVEKHFIEENETSAIVLSISKTGSQLFRDDPHDLDFIIICENYTKKRSKKFEQIGETVYDIIIIDKLAVDAQLDFQNITYIHPGVKFHNYFFELHENEYGTYKPTWDMLAHKEEYLAYLKQHYSNTLSNSMVKWKFSKMFVHYYIPLKMMQNNSTEITASMLEDIRKLYVRSEHNQSIINWVVQQL